MKEELWKIRGGYELQIYIKELRNLFIIRDGNYEGDSDYSFYTINKNKELIMTNFQYKKITLEEFKIMFPISKINNNYEIY